MKEVVILSSARTAGGKYGGTLKNFTAPKLGAIVIEDVIKRAGIKPDLIEQTVMGNAWQAAIGPNPARIASVWGGVPQDAPAVSINVRCGSSIQALIFGAQAIKSAMWILCLWVVLKVPTRFHMLWQKPAGDTEWARANSLI